jgi:hypothetical protein
MTVGMACSRAAPPRPTQDPVPGFVADCRPCRFQIGPGLAPFDFTFDIDSTADGRTVTAIETRADGSRRGERLTVHGMMPAAAGEKFFFGAVDLNHDGNLDLLIATRHGVANTYADYWRFAGDSSRFVYLGNYPMFTFDSASGRLKSYERGGEGGRIYAAREWGFEDDTLVVLREEVQESGGKPGEFLNVVRERAAGGLREVSRRSVKDPG